MPSSARCTTSSRYTRCSSGRTTPAASREESSRLSTSAVSWSTDSSTVASSSAVSSAEKPMSSTAQARHRGLRGGQRRAQVVADRRQQRAAQLVGLLDGLGLAGLLGQFALSHQPGGLFGDGGQHPPVAGGQPAAGHQHPELVVADLDRGVGGIDVDARVLAHARDDLARRRPPDPQHADRALRVGLPHPFQQRVQIRAAQHRAGEQRRAARLPARRASPRAPGWRHRRPARRPRRPPPAAPRWSRRCRVRRW